MPLSSLRFLVRSWRRLFGFVWRSTCLDILQHQAQVAGDAELPGFTLVHLRGLAGLEQLALAEQAMQAAREPAGLAQPRLAKGDEFFAWSRDGSACGFGWLSRRDRKVGPLTYINKPGRVFLYNFQTLPHYRRQGLYGALLRAMAAEPAAAGSAQLLVEVNQRNPESARVLLGQGFVRVAQARFVTLLGRFHTLVRRDSWASVLKNRRDRTTVLS